jgi:hypothetical protein
MPKTIIDDIDFAAIEAESIAYHPAPGWATMAQVDALQLDLADGDLVRILDERLTMLAMVVESVEHGLRERIEELERTIEARRVATARGLLEAAEQMRAGSSDTRGRCPGSGAVTNRAEENGTGQRQSGRRHEPHHRGAHVAFQGPRSSK